MKKVTLLLVAISVVILSNANNIQLANVGISGQNVAGHYSLIGFDVTWENSWRVSSNENNYDAAWVFAKFRKKGTTSWLHATLNTTGHTAATGSAISTPADGKGIFIYRSVDGLGTVTFNANRLRWNYGVDGVLDSDSVEVNLYACEMVYVPQGAYYLGSNGSETGHFRRGDTDSAYLVSSEVAITVGPAANNLTFTASTYTGSPAGPIPAAFPKGFNAFYCMKYECSQQQYVDFLNNLDAIRAANRNNGGFTGTHPALVAPVPERAMDAVSIADIAAYTDWAGLRPMTETEYEKASRGYNIMPLVNEYVWGNTTINNATGIVNPGLDNETVTSGNTIYAGSSIGSRPLRTGIFATTTTNRVSSGGTYYGIMEMGGNELEYVITVGSATGRAFTGMHGDGNLDVDGTSDMTQINTAAPWGNRGGAYNSGTTFQRTSDRTYGNLGPSNGVGARPGGYGLRCVRTAP